MPHSSNVIRRGAGASCQKAPEMNIVAEVNVATATAIIASTEDPFKVLVASSKKHPFPVLPGGKIEIKDGLDDSLTPGLRCILREVPEECGTPLINPRYLGTATDPNRDIRIVPISSLENVLVSPELPADLAKDGFVKAHYGCPDHIYLGQIDVAAMGATAELNNLKFIDLRKLQLGQLSAGHDVVALTYKLMLLRDSTTLSPSMLSDFSKDAEMLSRY